MIEMPRKPTYPGRIIKEDYLLPLSISIKDMAGNLGVSKKTVSKIVNEKGSITPEMALGLSRAFDTMPDLWMNLQSNYDLWNVKNLSITWQLVKPISANLLHSM